MILQERSEEICIRAFRLHGIDTVLKGADTAASIFECLSNPIVATILLEREGVWGEFLTYAG